MRILRTILPSVLTIAVLYLLNNPLGGIPALGKLLDPVSGFWANAEPVKKDFSFTVPSGITGNEVEVWFDERMVPHVNAENDYDLFYAQGYIHAYFRLWQMDLQTRAAGGRLSEVIGDKTLEYDRLQRRKGMVFGAENSLSAMEADTRTKQVLDAYRDGINAYISSLDYAHYPLEYKLMGFEPEPWENIRTALMLMYMADGLTSGVDDIGLSYYKDIIPGRIDELFPDIIPGATPVIPPGTHFDTPSLSRPVPPAEDPFVSFKELSAKEAEPHNDGVGSNNWAVSGRRTKSGKAILCDDPHLSLNLPSIWYEIQLHAPGVNVYGVSLPGSPGVIIGFNDNIAWGFTNNYRDVKDYYAIDKIDNNSYRFNGVAKQFNKRVEVIKVKGKKDVLDTVDYTIHGPVTYDDNFKEPGGVKAPLAMRWMAHDASNELLAVYLYNRANDYDEFVKGIQYFTCPAQNFAYADTKGNIAIWGQGQFINKWKDQGKYVMRGDDSTTLWGDKIPTSENPHVLNPEQGYVASANQTVTDTTYPYWYNGGFSEMRAWRINEMLDTAKDLTKEDMFAMQQDVHTILARKMLPLMLQVLDSNEAGNSKYAMLLKNWKYNLSAESPEATIFRLWWSSFYSSYWQAKYGKSPAGLYPSTERTMQLMLESSDDVSGAGKYLVSSYMSIQDTLAQLEKEYGLEWYKVKNTTVRHLARIMPFSYAGLETGGWGTTVNAIKDNHGPSWRMVVEMDDVPKAYGVYPGGQSGNPGSKYYADFLNSWAEGKYYDIVFFSRNAPPDTNKIMYTWKMQPGKK